MRTPRSARRDRFPHMPEPYRFQPLEAIRVLIEHGVEFVVIGGYAAVLHGSPTYTNDADVCPDRSLENLERLAAALRDLDARIRTDAEPEGLPVAIDATFLNRIDVALNLMTRYGDLDISFRPAAFPNGYADLLPHAVDYEVGDLVVKVASLADIIRSKETAARPKDLAALPVLKALEDEIADQAARDEG